MSNYFMLLVVVLSFLGVAVAMQGERCSQRELPPCARETIYNLLNSIDAKIAQETGENAPLSTAILNVLYNANPFDLRAAFKIYTQPSEAIEMLEELISKQ